MGEVGLLQQRPAFEKNVLSIRSIAEHDYALNSWASFKSSIVQQILKEKKGIEISVMQQKMKRHWSEKWKKLKANSDKKKKKMASLIREILKKDREKKQKKLGAALNQRFYAGFVPYKEVKEEFIQIKAGPAAVRKRIELFQAHKRDYVDTTNVLAFCKPTYRLKGRGCARTDTLILNGSGKRHIYVHRVVNEWGPQTRGIDPGSINHPNPPDPLLTKNADDKAALEAALAAEICKTCGGKTDNDCPLSLRERLDNAEIHLQLRGPVPLDIYTRISNIEKKILGLEGVSPEYGDRKNASVQWNDGGKEEFTPLTKRCYSKEELNMRLALLRNKAPSKPKAEKKKTKKMIQIDIKNELYKKGKNNYLKNKNIDVKNKKNSVNNKKNYVKKKTDVKSINVAKSKIDIKSKIGVKLITCSK